MHWKEQIPPLVPDNLRYERLADGRPGFSWSPPAQAADGDTAFRYAVYRFTNAAPAPEDRERAENLIGIEGRPDHVISVPDLDGPFYYGITSLDRNSNESDLSAVIHVPAPEIPSSLVHEIKPELPAAVAVKWKGPNLPAYYHLQVSARNDFSELISDQNALVDTFEILQDLDGLSAYYWRVRTQHAGGSSEGIIHFHALLQIMNKGVKNPSTIAFIIE